MIGRPQCHNTSPSFFIKSRTAVSQSTCLLMQDTQNSLQTLWVSMLWPMCLFWTNVVMDIKPKKGLSKMFVFFILHAFLEVWKLSCRLESTIPWQRWTLIHNIKNGDEILMAWPLNLKVACHLHNMCKAQNQIQNFNYDSNITNYLIYHLWHLKGVDY